MRSNEEAMVNLGLLEAKEDLAPPPKKTKKASLLSYMPVHLPQRQRYERESKKNKNYKAPSYNPPSDDDFCDDEEEEEEEVPDEENFSDAEMETLIEELADQCGQGGVSSEGMRMEEVYKQPRRGQHHHHHTLMREETLPPTPYPLLDERGICLLRTGHLDLSFSSSLCSRTSTSIQKLINSSHMEQLPCGAYRVLLLQQQSQEGSTMTHNPLLFLDGNLAQLCHKLKQRYPCTHPSNLLSFLCSRRLQHHLPNPTPLPLLGAPPPTYSEDTVGLFACPASLLPSFSHAEDPSSQADGWSFLSLHRKDLLAEWHSHGEGSSVSVLYYKTPSREDVMKVCMEKEGLEHLYQDAIHVYESPSKDLLNLAILVYKDRLLSPKKDVYCVYKKDACPCGVLTYAVLRL